MLIDLSNVKASAGGGTLPVGEYVAYIDSAELKSTKEGQGQYIKTVWKIADGQFKNRTIFQNYNIKSTSEKAQEIGLSDLRKILEVNARTSFQIKSTEELVGFKALVYVKVKTQVGYEDTNVISGYKPVKTTATVTPQKGVSSVSVPGF